MLGLGQGPLDVVVLNFVSGLIVSLSVSVADSVSVSIIVSVSITIHTSRTGDDARCETAAEHCTGSKDGRPG